MKTIQFTLISFGALLISACHSSKKTSTFTTTNPTTNTVTVTAAPTPTVAEAKPKSWTGIYAPGSEELTAIKAQFPDATSEQLAQGYTLYAQSACISCHNAKSIYKFDVISWKLIIDKMAREAKITDVQKEAVYRYVLAIKATQPK